MTRSSLIQTITIPTIEDDALLCFGQIEDHFPFIPKRIYYITKPKKNEPRGCHAHKETEQLLFCIQGNVRMILDDGDNKEEIVLDKPNVGILLHKMVWHEMHDMDENTILLVLASLKFNPADYIRSYDQYIKLIKKENYKR